MWNWKYAFIATAISFAAYAAVAADPEFPIVSPQASSGGIQIVQETWDGPADQPGNHMDSAHQAFLAVDARTAAAELRKAAEHLRDAAGEATEASKQSLTRSAHELESLAKRTEEGSVKSVRELDSAFARALHSLAHHHYVMAEKAWVAKEAKRSGKQLRAAADNLKRASAWSGQKLHAATSEVVRETRIISSKLVGGTGVKHGEAGNGIHAFGKQVETVGQGIEPHPLPPSE